MPSFRRQLVALGFFLLVVFAAAAVGGLLTGASVGNWYPTIQKPPWTPPNWVFGPVWSVLYFGMAISAWLVWRRNRQTPVAEAMARFMVQLLLNTAWSGLFFGLRLPGAAFVEILALWIAIVATLISFGRVHRGAAALMTPYLLWVTFAAALNFAIWRLNV